MMAAPAPRPSVPPQAELPLPPPFMTGVGEVHLLDRLAVVFRHLRLVMAVFVLVLTLALLRSYSTTPLYRAQAQILIEDERSIAVAGLNSTDPAYWQEAEPYYQTQYRILEGRSLARRVVRRLELEKHPEYGAPPEGGPSQAIRSARDALQAAFRRALGRDTPEPQAAPREPGEGDTEAPLVNALLGGVQVEPIKQTRLVTLHYISPNPAFAALAVNTLAEEYVAQNLDLRMESTQKQLAFLEGAIAEQQQKVEDLELRMAQHRGAQGSTADGRQNIVISTLTSLTEALAKARNARLEKEAIYRQIEGLDPKTASVDTFPVIAQNLTIQTLRNDLGKMEAERASRLAGGAGQNHPRVRELSTDIGELRNRLTLEIQRAMLTVRNEYRSALATEQSLARSLEEQKQRAAELDQRNVAYIPLERQAESERNVYQTLIQQQKELAIVANSKANNVKLMDAAEVPGAPFTPNHRRDLLMGLVLGLTLGVGLAFGIEYLDDTVKTPEDISRRLKLPLLGLVPAVRGQVSPVLSDRVPHDFGEAFRSLRTSLVFTSGGESTRIIAVTSTQPLEGKTTTACNLALALALGGARVLLIDADMRRPGLHKVMRMENGLGLSHLLTGQARIREAARPTVEPGLLVITAGRTPPNPSELLSSDRMKSLVTNLASGPFDWVIVDTPPVLAVTDAVILAPYLSGLVFVVGAEMTRIGHAERALEILQTSRPRLVGTVLNRVDFDRNKYYYSRYYGYHYKSYYGQAGVSA
jgi:capsular exopolysaccharide synthesis family protein